MWILLSLVSAVLLGCYDIAKKLAVHDNAVAPVLFLNVLTGATICLPFILLSTSSQVSDDSWLKESVFYVAPLDARQHTLLALKSFLVGCSWTFAFIALKRLPISIATPIRATSPVWTIAAAVLLMGERPQPLQWVGIGIVLVAFVAFSLTGRREGIQFHRDRGVLLMILATLLGSGSALYDKYLLQTIRITPATLQAWFSIYLVIVMLPWVVWWFFKERVSHPFQWRWSIPLIALCLITADFVYFSAVSYPEALISVISPVRRSSVLISFLVGIFWLHEKNGVRKAFCITSLLTGVYLLSLAK